jgi:phage shock protein C
MNPKKLYRSESNKVVAGIIGGLGEYLNIDPVPLRLLWLLIVVLTGIFPGLIIYGIAIMIVPRKPHFHETSGGSTSQ